jgi:SAM-dependent methyltransferase
MTVRVPAADAVARAAADSPLTEGPAFSGLADADELRFREEIEPELRGDGVVSWMARKELAHKLAHVLRHAAVRPAGTVVELGAGTCWLSATLARHPAVERVVAVEFSRHRLEQLAPIAIAALGAPAAKVERRRADFNAPGLPDGCADLVVTDAAFHHAADPDHLAAVAFALLAPGGSLLLFREPTLALLRRTRDHGIEGQHGSFEHEDTAAGYERRLRAAGFADVRRVAAPGATGRRGRMLLRPPLSWLNGIAFAEYAYVGTRAGPGRPGRSRG